MSPSLGYTRWRRVPNTAVLFCSSMSVALAQTCSVCKDGQSVPLPEKGINVEGIPINNCGTLDTTAALLPADSDFCVSIQSIGTLCGCPIPESACSLCHDESSVTNPQLELSNYPSADYIPASPAGVFLTCETMEALLHSHSAEDNLCINIQIDVSASCGCPTPPTMSPASDSVALPSASPVSADPGTSIGKELCTPCRDGSPITMPNRTLNLGELPIETCADLETFSALLDQESSECSGLQSLGSLCGCPVSEGACTFCPNGERVPKPDQTLDWFSGFLVDIPETFSSIGDSLTCEMMEAITLDPPPDVFQSSPALVCLGTQLKSSICGCSPDWRSKILIWFYRGSGIVSLIVSSNYRYQAGAWTNLSCFRGLCSLYLIS